MAFNRRNSTQVEGGYSVVVHQDGDQVVAEDHSGHIIREGSLGEDDAAVIQAAIDYLSSGGKVLILDGTYAINSTIQLSGSVWISGVGESTVLRMADGVNINMITSTNKTSVTIENMKLDGNKASNTGGSCVALFQAEKHVVQNLHIVDAPYHGIAITGVNGYATDNIVTDCIIENSVHRNIIFDPRVKSSIISNNICLNANLANILVGHGSFDVQILDNFCSGTNVAEGIIVHQDSSGCVISGNRVLDSARAGILLNTHTCQCVVSSNICTDNQHGIHVCAGTTDGIYDFVTDGDTERNIVAGNICDSNTEDGILLSYIGDGKVTKRTGVMDNICISNGGTGINETTGQYKNYVFGNQVAGNGTAQISTTGPDTSAFNNYGIAPYDWGNRASTPTPFGEGDSYYDTTTHKRYVYDGTSWQALW